MALTKKIKLPSDVDVDYWRIGTVHRIETRDDRTAAAEYTVEPYVSAAARAAGAEPAGKPALHRVTLTELEAAVIRRVLYGAERREHFPDAKDHVDDTDVPLTLMPTALKDWEVEAMAAAFNAELAKRGLQK